MRILHILNDIQEIGNGIVNVAVDLACLQAKAGHEVGVASAGGEYELLLARVLRARAGYALVSTVHNEFQRSAVLMGLADRVIAVSKTVAYSMARRGIPQKKLRVGIQRHAGQPFEPDYSILQHS